MLFIVFGSLLSVLTRNLYLIVRNMSYSIIMEGK